MNKNINLILEGLKTSKLNPDADLLDMEEDETLRNKNCSVWLDYDKMTIRGTDTKGRKLTTSGKKDVFKSWHDVLIDWSDRTTLDDVKKITSKYGYTILESTKFELGTVFKPAKSDIDKMQGYYDKGSNPKTLANTVKDLDKAQSRYYIALSMNWTDCADNFRRRCLELGSSEDVLKELESQASKSVTPNSGKKTISTKTSIPDTPF